MKPILFHIGPIAVPSFFMMVTVGALIMTFLAAHIAKKEGLKEVVMLDFGIIGMTVGVLGAKFFHVIFEDSDYYLSNPLRIFYIWQGGLVSVGALISTIIGWIVYLKVKKLDYWKYLDIPALVAPIILFFTRVGCFLAGCCFGKPTDSWYGVVFPIGSFAGDTYRGIHIIPVQVFFQINAIVMGVVLYLTYKYRKFYGQIIATFLIYYGVSRFMIEFLRSTHERHLYFGMFPAAQLTMIGFIIIGILIWIFTRKNKVSQ